MAERTEDVQAHWTRPGVLARIDAALTELGHDPQNLSPEILATLEHLHSGGLATTRRQANRIAVTEDSRVLDVGCGIGGPARYLAHTYGCRVDGIDLTPELIETGRVLTERCKLADRVVLQVGTCLQSRWILRAKRLEILRELVPDFTRLAIVANVGNPGAVLEDARGRGSGPSARSANRPLEIRQAQDIVSLDNAASLVSAFRQSGLPCQVQQRRSGSVQNVNCSRTACIGNRFPRPGGHQRNGRPAGRFAASLNNSGCRNGRTT